MGIGRTGGRISSSVCRAIIATSIVWLLIDVVVLFYYLDPTPTRVDRPVVRGDRSVDHPRKADSDKNGPFRVEEKDIDDSVRKELKRLLSVKSFQQPEHGERGAGYDVLPSFEEEKKKRFLENQFNVMASEMISVNRSLPDYRSRDCLANADQIDESTLPKTSIIIVFHNEAWTTLLRTLHSVVNRSPLALIEEIILVDDKSDREYLKKPLQAYLEQFPIPIHLVHLPNRSGLIRARLTGSDMSKGSVLLFLDAHVEVTPGWLPPLLARVKEDRKRVVAPIIDVISDDDFSYVTASDSTWGGFNWHLNFRWYNVPKRETQRRGTDKSTPIRTPTIAGGLFAIDKQFFYDLGSYDQGMEVWGGENLEISFRAWMCGGSLEIHPCSRVGHVFRKQTPYTFPGGTSKVIHHNAARTAEVWMDEYKAFFYKMVPAARVVDAGDLTERHNLRKGLQCKSFKWYLQNIYPEAPVPADYRSLGSVSNIVTGACLDTLGKKDSQPAGLRPCHGAGGNQAWALTGAGEFRTDEWCLSSGNVFGVGGNDVLMEKCGVGKVNTKHIFKFDPQTKQIRHVKTGKCMTAEGERATLSACDAEKAQKWFLEGFTSN